MTDFRVEVINNETITRGRWIVNSLSTSKDHAVDFIYDNNFYKALNAKVNVAKVGAYKGIHRVTSESLSYKWLIFLEAARRKVQHTTQLRIRTILHPYLSRQFITNDQALKYNRLKHSVFTDTMQAGIVLRRVNWYAQVYSADFGWSRVNLMNRKGGPHETLYLFFERDYVTPKMVMGRSKEQTLGSFKIKFQEAYFHINHTEPYSPWQLQAEGTIKELKKGAGRKMVWAGATKRVWDNALEFEVCVRSNTVLDIYMFQG